MGNKNGNLLAGFKQELQFQSPILSSLFEGALLSVRSQEIHDPSVDLLDALKQGATARYAQRIYAGSIFLVLDQWIRELAEQLYLTNNEWKQFGEKIGRAPLAGLIWATGNNFRHHREWEKKPSKLASPSIELLEAAGIHGGWTDNCAIQVLQIIGTRTYDELQCKVEKLADEMWRKSRNAG